MNQNGINQFLITKQMNSRMSTTLKMFGKQHDIIKEILTHIYTIEHVLVKANVVTEQQLRILIAEAKKKPIMDLGKKTLDQMLNDLNNLGDGL